ncbi:Lectin domain containing protein [Quillaja saponaria]|uniref:Lectin domain containing protein n=1 Tax=Quillaja saponaria TaxID=32244 RepID=A0AAD7Q730_QUISA|nr:Lectin domain containing protein [Quillaja saponaria]
MVGIVFSNTQLQFLVILLVILTNTWTTCSEANTDHTPMQQELVRGFLAIPHSKPTVSEFQGILSDHTGNFSLGFLRVNQTQLALAVLHVPSSEPLWLANPTHLARWSYSTQLYFNGSLVISDPDTGYVWSTKTNGDRVVLLNSSNLQVQKNVDAGHSPSVIWQSFDFPTNTLVENQNFTDSMSLISSNGLYSMRLGSDFWALYAKYKTDTDQMYWQHKALEVKAEIVEGKGPIHARVHSDGYLAMYQTSNLPVDIQPFNSFQRTINGLLLVRLETDGNLKGYYWDGSKWALNYQAISDTCELPSPCGSYGLCTPGSGCSCLDNRKEYHSGGCLPAGNEDLCSEGIAKNSYQVLRRKGVELPYKEWMGYLTTSSMEKCQGFCERNCSCWGTVYNNVTGFCYIVDYPIQTLVGVSDETKMGYFKVRDQGTGRKKMQVGIGVGVGVLSGAVILIGLIGFGVYRTWKKRRGVKGFLEEEGGVSPGPYKDLGSASFRTIEMYNK